MPKFLGFDVSGPPNQRERDSLERRRTRLEQAQDSVATSVSKYVDMVDAARKRVDRIQFRTGYAYRSTAASTASDRAAPPRDERPPATRLLTPRGAALRFHILALAEGQIRTRAGATPSNRRPLRPDYDNKVGWTDLLASSAQWAGSGRVVMSAQDKRLRQVTSSLDLLEASGLVRLPRKTRAKGKYEEFELLDETTSRKPPEEPLPYTVPKRSESVFSLPVEFVTRGWVHVLEDSEIAVLLMTASGVGSIDPAHVAIPARVRLQHYGIGPDAFEAHRWLERFGLIDVFEVGRNSDGTAENFAEEGAMLHRLAMKKDGFEADAPTTVRGAIEKRLKMATP
ncbi:MULTISPECIES: hypothetical protein [unclassified Nocardioides]|uniref:hypothetical protein n=1 Tax=unclassified Nocardioides TaxID=2615069 RepID=UPI000056F9DC|nr:MULTISPECIES: hypothetical protein [unclassified Nocardioides]ABL84144.1 conserved hypothetical protein [Nocardioides sp. JS614]